MIGSSSAMSTDLRRRRGRLVEHVGAKDPGHFAPRGHAGRDQRVGVILDRWNPAASMARRMSIDVCRDDRGLDRIRRREQLSERDAPRESGGATPIAGGSGRRSWQVSHRRRTMPQTDNALQAFGDRVWLQTEIEKMRHRAGESSVPTEPRTRHPSLAACQAIAATSASRSSPTSRTFGCCVSAVCSALMRVEPLRALTAI